MDTLEPVGAQSAQRLASPANVAEHVLAGGGEMGERMRAFDWASTPLGRPEQWPKSLKTCVRIMLTSRQPIWIGWGEQLTYLYNDPYKSIIGGKHPDALGQPTERVWHEIWDVIGPMLSQAMHGSEGTYVEAMRLIMARNGYDEETYYTFSYSPVPNDEGGTGGIICANTDDTRRVIGERQMALLRELAARTTDARSIADASNWAAAALSTDAFDLPFALIYLLDASGKAVTLAGSVGLQSGEHASPAVVRLDEPAIWPFAEVLAARESLLVRLDRSFGALPGGAWDRPPASAAVVPFATGSEHGQIGFLVAGLNPFRLYDDDYAGFLRLASGQISASIRNAEAYQEERRRAESLTQLDRAKTAFFSNVSHELRTPLTLLLAPAEDALADVGTLPRNRERIEVIHRNALRLLRMVNTLLDFSRIEAGRVQSQFEPTDLAACTAELASSFRSAIERAGLRFVVEGETLPQPVYVDRDMWEKVVLNLLSNAFKHTFDGSISVDVRTEDGQAVLEVRDTGVGIPPEQLPRIFERFHRVPNARSRTQEGTGIGLALVQELVKLHGGTMRVESAVNAGTTFTVSIPYGAAHLDADRIVPAHASTRTAFSTAAYVEEALRWLPASASTEETGEERDAVAGSEESHAITSARVLVADDNADMRDYLSRLLRERGWKVDAAANGREAFELARTRQPDVVLTDVMMPELDGFELLEALRSDPATRSLPVILLSARAGEEARIEGMRAGADDYVVKPFAARELLVRVEAQVRRARTLADERQRKEEKDRLLAAVEAERSRFRELFTRAPAAIAVLRGPDHVFDVANPNYLGLVGGRDVIGKPVRQALPELVGQSVFELLDEVYRTDTPFVAEQYPAMIDGDGDGKPEEHFYNFVYQPIHDEAGSVSGVFAHLIEVSELVRARRSAEEANRAKSEFLAAMSHELRTPLNAIAGYTQLIELGVHGPVTAPQLEALERIQRSQQHLLSLINDVLNFAKLEAGRVEYEIEDVRLAEVVAEVLAMVEPQLTVHRLGMVVDVADDIVARADREKVRQVLLNLLSNAIKFTPLDGRITVDSPVRESGEASSGFVFLRVSDTGIGIAPDKLDSIFDPFVQVHRNLKRVTDGTGLGLAISRDLARGMSGELRVRSEEGRGSTFTLMLVAAPAGETEDSQPLLARNNLDAGGD